MDTVENTIEKSKNISLMKAVRQHSFGGPEVLHYEDAPIPELKEGEVLVKVHAIGMNPPDWYLRNGYKSLPEGWQPKGSFPIILGTDISGVIQKVADDIKNFTIGDEVYSMVRFPEGVFGESQAYAQFVSIPATQVALKPKGIDHIHAAAAPMSLLTAWQFLIDIGHNEQNPLQPHQHEPVPLNGKRVLVNGAAGGVGHFALQIAKWKGANVIAVASGRQEEFLKNLSADEFIDYTKTNAHEVVQGIDLVIDAVGGPETGRFLGTLKPGGALFPIFPLGYDRTQEAKNLGVIVSAKQVRSNGEQLSQIASQLNNGTIKVAIDSVFALEDAVKAHQRAEDGHIQGKIVLKVV